MNQTPDIQGIQGIGTPETRIYVAQGEHAIAQGPGVVISTLLGSCVAVCLWDPILQLGGMNHFVLPEEGETLAGMSGYGVNAMELVVNGLIRRGAERRNFRAKAFGGATMIAGLSDAGKRNALFALDYLIREKIPCDAQSLGGSLARRLEFWPADGRARLKLLSNSTVREFSPAGSAPPCGIEIF